MISHAEAISIYTKWCGNTDGYIYYMTGDNFMLGSKKMAQVSDNELSEWPG